jgi:hypothetical protein
MGQPHSRWGGGVGDRLDELSDAVGALVMFSNPCMYGGIAGSGMVVEVHVARDGVVSKASWHIRLHA